MTTAGILYGIGVGVAFIGGLFVGAMAGWDGGFAAGQSVEKKRGGR